MTIMMQLTHDEIQRELPYAIICTAHESSVWETARRKRRWKQEFTEKERQTASRIFRLAHTWYLTRGVPSSVLLSKDTYRLWKKLGDFCASL